VLAVVISTTLSPNPLCAVVCIFLWFVFGYSYNSGLSKESLLGFLSISICYVALAAWGWLLSHGGLTSLGWLYLGYIFTVILFQISWSGHLKEMGVAERSNLLIKMGARLEGGGFEPGYSFLYGMGVKAVGLWLLSQMISGVVEVAWYVSSVVGIAALCGVLCMPRRYDRDKELKKMSLMEILSIYAPIPLMVGWGAASVLMACGVIYFYAMNKALWGVSYPKV